MKESNWEPKYKNYSNTTQREITLSNMITKNTLRLLMKFWKMYKNSTPISLLASSLQDLKHGQMKRMKRCLMKFASWNGNILWDSTLSSKKLFMDPWPNTMKLLTGFWKNTLIWTTRRCITLGNQKTKQIRTWKLLFSQAVWESVTVLTPYRELNSWPTKNTFALSRIQPPIFCSVTQETQEMLQPQFC